jgi:hypothetical protein
MRRLAILFAILAALSTIENIALSGTFAGRLTRGLTQVMQAPRRVCGLLIRLTGWRMFLTGPLRLAGPWLSRSN